MLTKEGREGKGGERCSVYVGKKNVRKAEYHREGKDVMTETLQELQCATSLTQIQLNCVQLNDGAR